MMEELFSRLSEPFELREATPYGEGLRDWLLFIATGERRFS
jgi:hypothetical protein